MQIHVVMKRNTKSFVGPRRGPNKTDPYCFLHFISSYDVQFSGTQKRRGETVDMLSSYVPYQSTSMPFPELDIHNQSNLPVKWEKYLNSFDNFVTNMNFHEDCPKKALLLY